MEQYRPSRFNLLPEVIKNLLIINGIFFLATYILASSGIDLNDRLGLHYFESEKFRPYQIITYMFMHGSLTHIALNMFALWMFGVPVENYWGAKRFLTYYFLTGIGAAVTHYAIVYFRLNPELVEINNYIASHNLSDADLSQIYEQRTALLNAPVIIGASGAVFGVLLAYGMLFPNTLLYVYFLLPIKAKYLVIIYGLIELFSGVANGPEDNVAHFAHLGGLAFGFIIIMYWRYKNRPRNNFHN